MGQRRIVGVAALALQGFARAQIDPCTMTAVHRLARGIDQLQAQRRVSGYPRSHRAVRLYRHIADNFAHAEISRPPELGSGDIPDILVGDQHALGNPQKTHLPLFRGHQGRIPELLERGNTGKPRVIETDKPAIHVVDTANIQSRQVVFSEGIVPLIGHGLRWQGSRRCHSQFCDPEIRLRGDHWPLSFLGRVQNP